MAPQEKTEIVQDLERSRQELLDSITGLTEEQAKLRPAPDRWSVLDCVEHVAFVEDRFLGWLGNAKKLDEPRVNKENEAGLMGRVPDRSARVQAPEAVRPTGRYATLGEALQQFETNRARSIAFAQDRCDDLYCLASEHPRFGPVNGVELLIIIAGHSRRHTEQIREVRAALAQA